METVRTAVELPESTGKVALHGYCLGALMVFLTAVRYNDLDAAVAYHGADTDKYLTRLCLGPTSCIECLPHSGWHGSLIGALHTTDKFPNGPRFSSGTSPLQGTHRLAQLRQQSGNSA